MEGRIIGERSLETARREIEKKERRKNSTTFR